MVLHQQKEEVGGFRHRVRSTWQLSWLALRLALDRLFLSSTAQMHTLKHSSRILHKGFISCCRNSISGCLLRTLAFLIYCLKLDVSYLGDLMGCCKNWGAAGASSCKYNIHGSLRLMLFAFAGAYQTCWFGDFIVQTKCCSWEPTVVGKMHDSQGFEGHLQMKSWLWH